MRKIPPNLARTSSTFIFSFPPNFQCHVGLKLIINIRPFGFETVYLLCYFSNPFINPMTSLLSNAFFSSLIALIPATVLILHNVEMSPAKICYLSVKIPP